MTSPRPAPFGHGAVLSNRIIKAGALVQHANCGTPIGILCYNPATQRIDRFDFDRDWACKRGVWQWTQHRVHASRHPQVLSHRAHPGVSPTYGWDHPGWVRPSIQWDEADAAPPVADAWCAVCKQPFRLDFGGLLLQVEAKSRALHSEFAELVAVEVARTRVLGEEDDIPF